MMRITATQLTQAAAAHLDPESAAKLTREQITLLSPAEKATWAAAVRTYKREAEKAAFASKVGEKSYKCAYCRDSQWLSVLPEWVAFEAVVITSKEQIAWCDNHDRWNTVRIACDCHRGQLYGNPSDPQNVRPLPIKRFGEFFGKPITQHDLGGYILQYRKQRAAEHAAEDERRAEEKLRKEQEQAA